MTWDTYRDEDRTIECIKQNQCFHKHMPNDGVVVSHLNNMYTMCERRDHHIVFCAVE